MYTSNGEAINARNDKQILAFLLLEIGVWDGTQGVWRMNGRQDGNCR